MDNYRVQRYLAAIGVGLAISVLSADVFLPAWQTGAPVAQAAPLTELIYTGQLTAVDGTVITEPTGIQFALYTVSAGGTPLWTGTCGIVTLGSDGIISQPLAACAALPGDLNSESLYYLGVTVGDNAEATPRVPLAPQAISSLASQVGKLQQAIAEATPILSPSPTAIDAALVVSADGTFQFIGSSDESALGVANDFEAGGDAYIGGGLVVGASTSVSETLENSSFSLADDDLFVAGDAGVEGTLYTDGAFVVGATTTYDDGSIESSGALSINTGSNQTVTFGTGLVMTGGDMQVTGGLQVTGELDLQDTNIVNVGDVALDTISSDDGGSVKVLLGDGDGDDFIVNTNVLVVESDTDRVGVGLTNPTVKLDVAGNLQLRGQGDLRLADSDSSNYLALQAPATVTSNVTWTLPSADGTASQVLSTDGLGTLSWSSAASSIADDSLDFDKFEDTLDLDAATEINLGAFELAIDLDSTGDFVIKDGGVAFVTFADSGNVGIGNTAPTSLLDVNNTTTSTITVGANARVLNVQGAFTEAASGVHARIVGLEITPPTITAGVATVTDTASLYISDAPTATVTGVNYALWVDAGTSRFDDDVVITNGSATPLDIHRLGNTGAVVFNEQGADIDFRVEGVGTPSLFSVDSGLFSVGIGTTANAGALFEIDPTIDRLAVDTIGVFNIPAETINHTNTSSTLAIWGLQILGQPTISNNTATLTLTDAATLYLEGPPVADTNVSIGTAYSLWIDEGNSRFDGDVGIGTAAPEAKLQVTDGGLCVGSDANCNTDNDTEGTVYSGSTAMTLYDVAEMYPTKDTSISSGELVALDPDIGVFVKRAEAGDKRLLGVISTEPGVLLGGFAGTQFKDEHQVAVALSGRIPTNVSTENGDIEIGDLLTLSSQPGVARKAHSTSSGQASEEMIGYALEAYAGDGVGNIQVFVNLDQGEGLQLAGIGESAEALNLGDVLGESVTVEQGPSLEERVAVLAERVADLENDKLQMTNVPLSPEATEGHGNSNPNDPTSLIEDERRGAGDETEASNLSKLIEEAEGPEVMTAIEVRLVTLEAAFAEGFGEPREEQVVSENVMEESGGALIVGLVTDKVELEQLLSESDFNEIDKGNYRLWKVADEVVFTAKTRFAGAVEFLAEVTFGGRLTFTDKDLAGLAVMQEGDQSVVVTFETAYEIRPVVTISRVSGLAGGYRATNVTTKGFEIRIDSVEDENVFSWHALAVKDANVFWSGGSVTGANSDPLFGRGFIDPLAHEECSDYAFVRGFNDSDDDERHLGVDLSKEGGCTVQAVAPGRVTQAGWIDDESGYGVIIDHYDGVKSYSGHGQEGEIWVDEGDTVTTGQDIMRMGDSGETTGVHLHFGLIVNEEAMDPKGNVKIQHPQLRSSDFAGQANDQITNEEPELDVEDHAELEATVIDRQEVFTEEPEAAFTESFGEPREEVVEDDTQV